MVGYRLKLIVTIVAFMFLFPLSSFAQDPIKLSLVNVSEKGGSKGYKSVYKQLKKSDDIKLKSQKSIIKIAKKLKIKKSDLRSSKWRKKNSKKLGKLISRSKMESLILLDIYKGGKRVQLVSIGPNGKQLSSDVKKIKRGRISKGKVRDMLKTSFKPIVKAVLKERGGDEEEEEGEVEEEDEDEDEDADVEEEEEVEEEKVDKEEDEETDVEEEEEKTDKKDLEFPSLAEGYKINLGVVLGKREFKLTTTSGDPFTLKHESPYIGGGGSVDAIFANFGSMAFGGSLFGGFAPFTTLFQDPATQEVFEFSSRYSQLGVDLNLLIAFSKELTIIITGGAEATGVTIDANQFYTGSRYIAGRAGVGAGYNVGPILLKANLIVLAIFNTNIADGAFGEADGLGIGFAPNLGLSFDITDEISAGLRYDFRLLPAAMLKGPVIQGANSDATDIIHSGLITIGYSL